MKVLGVDLTRRPRSPESVEHVLVMLGDDARVVARQRVTSLPAVAAAVAELVGDEPFLLGVNTPVVVPAKPARGRPVENRIRRQFRFRLPAGGRSALLAEPLGVAGEALMAGLAAAGLPSLPYPDRDRRKSGLVETYPGLALKALLWDSSILAAVGDPGTAEELLRAFAPPAYRRSDLPARATWTDQAVALELLLRAIDGSSGFDLEPARDQLTLSRSFDDVEFAASLLDATLIAGTARRYLESPEQTVFIGDHEGGYVVLPADGTIRRLALGESRPTHGLFPETSLSERLAAHGRVQSPDLLNLPGRPRKLEATFDDRPVYEFDNLDEMMWWKHCRHVSGPRLPTEGLLEMRVVLETPTPAEGVDTKPLSLVRSRHRTLSFRFDPPRTWRTMVPTRDGRTYRFEVRRAVYEALPAGE